MKVENTTLGGKVGVRDKGERNEHLPVYKLREEFICHTPDLDLSVVEMGEKKLCMEYQELLLPFVSRSLAHLLQEDVEHFLTHPVIHNTHFYQSLFCLCLGCCTGR